MIELILKIFLKIIGLLVAGVLTIAVLESIKIRYKKNTEFSKPLALSGCAILGIIIGIISYLIYPDWILGIYVLDVIILIISPIIVGRITEKIGVNRKQGERFITTFEGGAVLAFSYSFARIILLIFIT